MSVLACVMLATFATAFMASLKDDALDQSQPLIFAQLTPGYWVSAAQLGRKGQAPRFGGFGAGADVVFEVTYAIPDGKVFVTPAPRIPRRAPGTGTAAIAYPHFAADYAQVSQPELVRTQKGVIYQQQLGIKRVERRGKSATWRFHVRYQASADHAKAPITVAHLPLDIEVPRYQVLIDSSLPPHV